MIFFEPPTFSSLLLHFKLYFSKTLKSFMVTLMALSWPYSPTVTIISHYSISISVCLSVYLYFFSLSVCLTVFPLVRLIIIVLSFCLFVGFLCFFLSLSHSFGCLFKYLSVLCSYLSSLCLSLS